MEKAVLRISGLFFGLVNSIVAFVDDLCDLLRGVLISWTVGNLLGPIFWCLVNFGHIHIHGYEHARDSVKKGGVVILSSHPTLFESFFMHFMFWPYCLWMPRYFVYTVIDDTLFPRVLRWTLYPLRCIRMTRLNPKKGNGNPKRVAAKNARASGIMVKRLKRLGSVLIFAEGGRTCKGEEFVRFRGRRIRRVTGNVGVLFARAKGAIGLPVYVDFGNVTEPLSLLESIKRLGEEKFTIYIGEPFSVDGVPLRDINALIEQKILRA